MKFHVSKNFCSRAHTDRVYLATDKTFHLEDSDLPALQNNKHPQVMAGGAVWGTDITHVEKRTALGTVKVDYAPTVAAADRAAYKEVNKEQHKAHAEMKRLLADPDLKRRRVHKLEIRPGLVALDVVLYWSDKRRAWIAFCCEGFIS